MTTWIRKAKQLLRAFLSTDDNKYIITSEGKKINIFDKSFSFNPKASTTFTLKNKSSTVWTRKTMS